MKINDKVIIKPDDSEGNSELDGKIVDVDLMVDSNGKKHKTIFYVDVPSSENVSSFKNHPSLRWAREAMMLKGKNLTRKSFAYNEEDLTPRDEN